MLRRLLVLVLMIGFVALLFWAGVRNLRARRAAMQAAQNQHITITRDDDDSPSLHLRGQMAPGFTLVDTAGKKVSLADYKGKPVMVNFWATWCLPCREESPWIAEFREKYKSDGFEVLGLAADHEASKEDIARTAAKWGLHYPVLLSDAPTEKAYGGVDYLPESFYVSRDGKVLEETAGAPTKDEMEANIKRLIAAGGQ